MRRLAAIALVALAVLAPGRVDAGYEVTSGGLVDWDWAVVRDVTKYQVTDHAVAPDGSLIVSTGWAHDGYLHRIPPWGGTVDEHNRIGGKTYTVDGEPDDMLRLAMLQIEIRGDRLFGLDHHDEAASPRYPDGLDSHARLLEFDLDGRVLRNHGEFWNGPLTIDPRTRNLVLQTVSTVEPFDHHLLSYDPDSGKRTILVADEDPSSDDPLAVTYSPDGSRLFTLHLAGTTVDVRDRSGTFLFAIDLRQSMDSIVHGRPGTCFDGMLVTTRHDGSVWGTRPIPGAAPTLLASAGRPGAWSYTTIASDGNILTSRLDEVALLACAPFTPPKPGSVVERPPASAPGVLGARPSGSTASASGGRPIVASGVQAPGQPPIAGPAAPSAPQMGSVFQGNVAPQAGVADATEEQPVFGLSAARREPVLEAAWMRLALGAAFTTMLAGAAFALTRRTRPEVQRS